MSRLLAQPLSFCKISSQLYHVLEIPFIGRGSSQKTVNARTPVEQTCVEATCRRSRKPSSSRLLAQPPGGFPNCDPVGCQNSILARPKIGQKLLYVN